MCSLRQLPPPPNLLPEEKGQPLDIFAEFVGYEAVYRHRHAKMPGAFLSPQGRVALLGIAQRQISTKFRSKTRKRNNAKPMPASIKTLGDLIQVKRVERNLTPGHLAAKMGIATRLVRSWEDGTSQPDNRQLEILASLLGFGALDNYTTYDSCCSTHKTNHFEA
jgi:ribosome-binding protein aMBF1 (putative translation factor)